MASRYLGPEMGRWYADNNPSTAESRRGPTHTRVMVDDGFRQVDGLNPLTLLTKPWLPTNRRKRGTNDHRRPDSTARPPRSTRSG